MTESNRKIENKQVIVCEDVAALILEAARRIVAAAQDAIGKRGRFILALSGGSTPKPLYELLGTDPWRSQVDWASTHIFLADERFVPADDPQSNFRMIRQALLNTVPVPEGNVHRVRTESGSPEDAAAAYEQTIRRVVGAGEDDDIPQLDLILLGMGDNGHTASLFPGSPLLQETRRLVAGEYVAEVKMGRITMTLPLINRARLIMFLVAGANKTAVLHEVLAEHPQTIYPARLVRPVAGALQWLVDRAAMGQPGQEA
jgi:6-phosphogluconolactonase